MGKLEWEESSMFHAIEQDSRRDVIWRDAKSADFAATVTEGVSSGMSRAPGPERSTAFASGPIGG